MSLNYYMLPVRVPLPVPQPHVARTLICSQPSVIYYGRDIIPMHPLSLPIHFTRLRCQQSLPLLQRCQVPLPLGPGPTRCLVLRPIVSNGYRHQPIIIIR